MNKEPANLKDKKILDVCCGAKMFWFNKNNPLAVFCDIRSEEHILCDGRKLEVKPDLIMDFKALDFPDDQFNLVVFDPPHLTNAGKNSWMAKKIRTIRKNLASRLKARL